MTSNTFLSKKQEQHIIEAISRAENRTSGEIRIHLEKECDRDDSLARASRIFHELGMDQTELQNGVLIYIATEDHQASVYAGKGIHRQVEEHFWEDVLELLLDHFKEDKYEEGIIKAVEKVGEKLRELFPYREGDVNELSDDISYNDNNETA